MEGENEKEEPKQELKEDSPKTKDSVKKLSQNYWAISTIILGLLLVLSLVTRGGITGGITGGVIGVSDAEQKVIEFADSQGIDVELVDTVDLGNLYETTLLIQGQQTKVHITKDGQYFGSMTPLIITQDSPAQTQPPQEITKSDKPEIELFVMTHCPYGTQAEKGFIPAIEALGDKIDSSVKFVHYFLHEPEEAETQIQICIREEQPNKYIKYLKEFLKKGDTEASLTAAGIDKAKLDSCVTDKSESYYASDSALSEGYGVRGSPTLVVNGQIAQSGRDPASYLATICSAFNTAPEECEKILDSASPSPGFGYSTSAGPSTSAQC
ncbi:hypothetical protein CMI37_37880 [Candidatus Pacearchaeota archaeon]|nr:hypothetical protein [Candidatus Pacearchaeota archaeon]|tara:strand:- start:641 stop:1615 length:975 start_codon:yes stop_codon:yes gene_type:complete